MPDAASDPIYRVTFVNVNEIYQVYARNIYQSDIYGFVEVEAYLFGQETELIVDPKEERLKREFEGVQRSFIPANAILRIDEVSERGAATIMPAGDGKVINMSSLARAPSRDH